MPKFIVEYEYEYPVTIMDLAEAEIEVEADDEDDAEDVARELLNNPGFYVLSVTEVSND